MMKKNLPFSRHSVRNERNIPSDDCEGIQSCRPVAWMVKFTILNSVAWLVIAWVVRPHCKTYSTDVDSMLFHFWVNQTNDCWLQLIKMEQKYGWFDNLKSKFPENMHILITKTFYTKLFWLLLIQNISVWHRWAVTINEYAYLAGNEVYINTPLMMTICLVKIVSEKANIMTFTKEKC